VVAQASALARDEGLDHTPLPYFQDSPVLLKAPVVDAYVRTSATALRQRADAFHIERIAVATMINEATALYNAERYQEALARCRAAGGTACGEQLRPPNGIYLASVKLGRSVEAEQAFGKVAAYGFSTSQPGMKFLFNPGITVFWSDPKNQRAVCDVVAPDREGGHGREGPPEHRRPHQPHRIGAGQRCAVEPGRRLHPPAPRHRGRTAGRTREGQRGGLSREHREQRNRQRGRCARPARRVQDRALRLSAAGHLV